jgi:hypothetical protein
MAYKQSAIVNETTIEVGEHKIEEFAEDLGRLLGSARSKAEGWIGQRKAISEHLAGIRDTANGLLAQLGLGDGATAPAKRKAGRPRAQAASAPVDVTPAPLSTVTEGRKPRTMSAEARERISAAQKKRWAKLRRSQSK